MKHLLILVFCFPGFLHSFAQRPYTPDPKARAMHDKAINMYLRYNKNPDSVRSAINIMNKALALDSTYLLAWNSKLSFECQARLYDPALKTIRKMITIFPSELDLVFFNGVLSLKTGHTEEATAIFEQLIKLYDKIEDANEDADHLKITTINKALALKMLGRADESKQVLINLSVKEHDLTVRRHINAYISKGKEEIMNEIIDTR